MGIKFSNNASANIIQALTSTATSVSVTPGKGNLFPSLIEGDYFYATLAGNNGLEIVKVTNRVNDTMTIVRAQDNTTALSFDAGDLFELRIVAADFEDTVSELNAAIEEAVSNVANRAPIKHASTEDIYGLGSSTEYGHNKLSDTVSEYINAASGIAATPKAVHSGMDSLMEDIISAAEAAATNNNTFFTEVLSKVEEQDTRNDEQDAAIGTKISSVNGLTPDSNGNVDVGGMPLGTLFPYTGHDVPPGTLRADGSTYTNMRASFPDFYDWVVASGLTVPLAEYTLVEGSCGFYGVNESTGTVRMPTLAAGVFGTSVAGQYGVAVEAGLPGHTHTRGTMNITGQFMLNGGTEGGITSSGVFYQNGQGGSYSTGHDSGSSNPVVAFDASRSWTGETSQPTNPLYGKSDTVTPSHVKYPWVIVVYNAAVSASVAQAQEFIGLLDGKADKAQVDAALEEGLAGVVRSVNGVNADAAGNVALSVPATPEAYITETWSSGTSWYRKWSDGWIEQGGYLSGSNSVSVTFFVAFANTNFSLFTSLIGGKSSTFWPSDFAVSNITKTGFTTQGDQGTNVKKRNWYACGY